MDRSPVLAIGLALAASCATAACDIKVGEGGLAVDVASSRAHDTWTRTYTLDGAERFELINVNGRITVEPAAGEAIDVLAERTARASSVEAARELLGRVEIREEAGPGRVRIDVRPLRTFGAGGVEVRWTVKVPRGLAVDVRNTNGSILVTGLSGALRARTANGGVEARGLAATSVEASTVNGGVEVEVTTPLGPDGEVSLETVNGSVSLALPGSSRASVIARVTNGVISATGLVLEPSGEQTRRRLEGTLNGGGARVLLETTNGSVRLSKSTS